MIESNSFVSDQSDTHIQKIPIRRNTKPKPVSPIAYASFVKNNNCISTLRISDLKLTIKNSRFRYCMWQTKISRHYDFLLSGSKPVLVARILAFFDKTRCAIIIQRMARGCIARTFFKLRKYTHKDNNDRVVCVNDTDFYTLDEVKDIPYKLFFSYTDPNNFTYGFNILSLMFLYVKREEFKNPYNRSDIPRHVLDTMVYIYNLIGLLFPGTIVDFSPMKHNICVHRRPNIAPGRSNHITNHRRRPGPLPVVESESIYAVEPEVLTEIHDRMVVVRERSLSVRAIELFMEMNRLGNNTLSEWFWDLTKEECYRLYDVIYDLWQYRLHLPLSVKSQICPMGSPFEGSRINEHSYDNATINDIRESCLFVMENIIFSGIDVEYRKVGSLHVLTALTSVSLPARVVIRYLYESLI